MSQQDVLFKNASLINEGKKWTGDLLVKKGRIERIDKQIQTKGAVREIDASERILMPGVIDDQVHFREPGLTHKAEIKTETRAAVAGGTTSFMEMPNTKPPALTQELLEKKYQRAAEVAVANYSFFMGVSNDNIEEVLKTNKKKNEVCGLKIFMGSSTGNMLVDNQSTLAQIFANAEVLIATHCESEEVIRANKAKYPDANIVSMHPLIRDVEACYASSSFASELAKKYDTRLHILHITTGKELSLFSNEIPLAKKRLTSEVCIHHLTFTAKDYPQFGTQIQCNPAIKESSNREALWKGLLEDKLDIIATDHAPHTWQEKQQPYPASPSGLPLVQHGLLLMMMHVKNGRLSLEKMVEKMCHAPAICFQIKERGFLREGYFADLVLVDPRAETLVQKKNLLYKCGWSPLEGLVLPARVEKTLLNGQIVYENGKVNDDIRGMRLAFER